MVFNLLTFIELTLVDIPCITIYQNCTKNVENKGKISLMPSSKIWFSGTSFHKTHGAEWHYVETSHINFHPKWSRNMESTG
jgi:hypothetical protein